MLKLTILACFLTFATATTATASAADKCRAQKNNAVGKYLSCRFKAELKRVGSLDESAYALALTGCTTKLVGAWDKAEAKATAAGESCPDDLDLADLRAHLDTQADNVRHALGGDDLAACYPCGPDNDGAACDDLDACTQTDVCFGGVCTGTNPVSCGAPEECHAAGVCDPDTGTCSSAVLPDGAACEDGNLCTAPDTCDDGVCVGGAEVTCTALDECHVAGTCSPATGCSNPLIPLTAPIVKATIEETEVVLDGVTTYTMEGSVDNLLDASGTIDPARCHDPSLAPLRYHWVINTPLVNGYTARGIRNYRTSFPSPLPLEVDADSIPNFFPNPITFVIMTSRSPTAPFSNTTASVRAIYRNSALSIGQSTTCQTMQSTGSGCDIEAALAVTPGTPTSW